MNPWHHVRRAATTVAVIGTLALLPACSSDNDTSDDQDKPSAGTSTSSLSKASNDTLVATAKKVLLGKEKFRVTGQTVEDGEKLEIDLSYVGQDFVGYISSDDKGFTVVSVGDKSALKGEKAFWTESAGPDAAAQLSGKWVTGSDFKDLSDEFSRRGFVDETFKPEGKISRGQDKTVDGVRCFTLVDTDGKDVSYLYLDQKDGSPVGFAEKGSSGGVRFSYDDVKTPTLPGTIVDIDQLAG